MITKDDAKAVSETYEALETPPTPTNKWFEEIAEKATADEIDS